MKQPDFLSPNSLYLAIDQGGHASRALAFDHQGQLVGQGFHEISVTHPQSNWVEHDPEEMVGSIRSAIEKLVKELGSRSEMIVVAGLATQRSSIACWDRETGEPLSPIISWQDRRAHEWLSQFAPQAEQVHQATGLFMSAHYGASKLRWCLDNLAPVKQALEEKRLAFGPMVSFLLYRLLQERPLLTDPANASRTLLWNLKTLDWDKQLLEMFDIPREALPKCVPSCHEFGHIAVGDKSVPMRVVNGDQSAAMFAFGRVQPDTAYINAGTGAFVSRPLGHYPGYGRRLLTSIILQKNSEATYVLEGTVNGAGSALEWLEDELGIEQLYREMPAWFERSQSPLLFLNGISGLGAPYWIPDFESCFVGEGEIWDKAVAVTESIVFLLQENLEEMLKLSSPPRQIQISGGLATIDGLCQRLADLTGLALYRPVEREATARGVAYLLAGNPASWPEVDIGIWFKPKDNPALNKRYHHWRDAMHTRMRKR